MWKNLLIIKKYILLPDFLQNIEKIGSLKKYRFSQNPPVIPYFLSYEKSIVLIQGLRFCRQFCTVVIGSTVLCEP